MHTQRANILGSIGAQCPYMQACIYVSVTNTRKIKKNVKSGLPLAYWVWAMWGSRTKRRATLDKMSEFLGRRWHIVLLLDTKDAQVCGEFFKLPVSQIILTHLKILKYIMSLKLRHCEKATRFVIIFYLFWCWLSQNKWTIFFNFLWPWKHLNDMLN